ncbi:hypothetical protein SMICM304S_11441 [Streptomyces microflavus]
MKCPYTIAGDETMTRVPETAATWTSSSLGGA